MKKVILATTILLTTFFCAAQKVSCPPTVTDAGGNVYNTVLIGDQCWIAENMNIGIMIPGTTNQTDNGIFEKHCYGDNPSNCNIYGGLYQWNEMMQYGGTQSICPAGWIIPANYDWYWLSLILMTDAGGKIKTTGTIEGGTGLWYAPNTLATNSSGFSALPGGWKDGAGNFTGMGYNAFFYNTQGWWYDFKYYTQLNHSDGNIWRDGFQAPSYSMSVRCLKYVTPAVVPTVSTSSITGITATTALGGGNVTDDGGANVSARGIVWSANVNPTVANHDGITLDGTGVGEFTSNLVGLASETHYYVKAYATNSAGTAYGLEFEFTTIPSILILADLVIDAGTTACYNASQTITVSNSTVKTGGSVDFIAGGNIRFQPATKVENGGNMHAYITTDQSYCTQIKSMLTITDTESAIENEPVEIAKRSALFTLSPNPTAGTFILKMITVETAQTIRVEIYGMMGEVVMQSDLSGQPQYKFDLTGMTAGVYLVRVISGDKMGVEKLIMQ